MRVPRVQSQNRVLVSMVGRNQRGQSLIQMLMSVAVMGILTMVFTSMINTQNSQMKSLSEKMAALDLQQLLISVLSDGAICSYQLTNPGPWLTTAPATFNAAALTSPNPPLLTTGAGNAKTVAGCQSANGSTLFGGMFQTYLCDGTCRRQNPLTGDCTCPGGFTEAATNDFNSPLDAPCGSQEQYEGKGMRQIFCYR